MHPSHLRYTTAFLILVLGFLSGAAKHDPIGIANLGTRPDPTRIWVMSLNVENLFDLVQNKNKADDEFLPRGGGTTPVPKRKRAGSYDWTREKLQIKLGNLRRLIDATKGGARPDLLAALEVESELSGGYLAVALGFGPPLLTRGPDERGINVAQLFNESKGFEIRYVKEHTVATGPLGKNPTRNVLETGYVVNGKHTFIVLINHWPSQHNPPAHRMEMAKYVKGIVQERLKQDPKTTIVLLGDFNVIAKDSPHPFNDVLLAGDNLVDVETAFREDAKIPQSVKDSIPAGTYYYDPDHVWNSLDHIFVSKNALGDTGLTVDLSSFRIHRAAFATKTSKDGEEQVPMRYSFAATTPEKAGFTDHFPISVEFVDRD